MLLIQSFISLHHVSILCAPRGGRGTAHKPDLVRSLANKATGVCPTMKTGNIATYPRSHITSANTRRPWKYWSLPGDGSRRPLQEPEGNDKHFTFTITSSLLRPENVWQKVSVFVMFYKVTSSESVQDQKYFHWYSEVQPISSQE